MNKTPVFIRMPKTASCSIMNNIPYDIDLLKINPLKQFGSFNRNHSHFTLIEFSNTYKLDDYFTFTFVRNPFERLVSEFKYRKNKNNCWYTEKTFKEFVFNMNEEYEKFYKNNACDSWRHFITQTDFLSINGKIQVDFIGKFENLNEDYNKLCKILNIKNKPLEKKNVSPLKYNKNLMFYYNEKKLIDYVYNIYKDDFINFNYKNNLNVVKVI